MSTKRVKFPDNLHEWGMIPAMLHPNSDVPLWEQIDNSYGHGGGWRDFDGFVFSIVNGEYVAHYQPDPPMYEISRIVIGDETLVLFPHSWVLYVHSDGTNKMARID